MFDDKQIQGYKRITAPADLKERVMTACEDTQKVKVFSVPKAAYRLAPLAACLLLFLSVVTLNRNTDDALLLSAGDIQLASHSVELPNMAVSTAAMLRSVPALPQYTVTLSANMPVEILSADGFAACEEDGSITWTVEVFEEDTLYELFLLAGEVTYYVPLQYDAQNGSFSIRYEADNFDE